MRTFESLRRLCIGDFLCDRHALRDLLKGSLLGEVVYASEHKGDELH